MQQTMRIRSFLLIVFCFLSIGTSSATIAQAQTLRDISIQVHLLPDDQPVAGIKFRYGSAPSDKYGHVVIQVTENMAKPGKLLPLVLEQGSKYAFISPWNGEILVPGYSDSTELHLRPVNIYIAMRGDRRLLTDPKFRIAAENLIFNEEKGKEKAAYTPPFSHSSIQASLNLPQLNTADRFRGNLKFSEEQTSKGNKSQTNQGLNTLSQHFGLSPEEIVKAIQQWQDSSNDYYQRGIAASLLNHWTMAISAFDQSLKKDDEHSASTLYRKAEAQIHIKDYSGATDSLEKALTKKPDDIEYLISLSRVCLQGSRPDKALKYSSEAVALGITTRSSQLTDARLNDADILNSLLQFDEATKQYEAIFQSLPPNDGSSQLDLVYSVGQRLIRQYEIDGGTRAAESLEVLDRMESARVNRFRGKSNEKLLLGSLINIKRAQTFIAIKKPEAAQKSSITADVMYSQASHIHGTDQANAVDIATIGIDLEMLHIDMVTAANKKEVALVSLRNLLHRMQNKAFSRPDVLPSYYGRISQMFLALDSPSDAEQTIQPLTKGTNPQLSVYLRSMNLMQIGLYYGDHEQYDRAVQIFKAVIGDADNAGPYKNDKLIGSVHFALSQVYGFIRQDAHSDLEKAKYHDLERDERHNALVILEKDPKVNWELLSEIYTAMSQDLAEAIDKGNLDASAREKAFNQAEGDLISAKTLLVGHDSTGQLRFNMQLRLLDLFSINSMDSFVNRDVKRTIYITEAIDLIEGPIKSSHGNVAKSVQTILNNLDVPESFLPDPTGVVKQKPLPPSFIALLRRLTLLTNLVIDDNTRKSINVGIVVRYATALAMQNDYTLAEHAIQEQIHNDAKAPDPQVLRNRILLYYQSRIEAMEGSLMEAEGHAAEALSGVPAGQDDRNEPQRSMLLWRAYLMEKQNNIAGATELRKRVASAEQDSAPVHP